MNEERLAKGLGWFGIGLGVAEMLAPKTLGSALGMESRAQLLRLYGLREITTGIGILSQPRMGPWLWGRVAGDLLDLATLSTLPQGKRGNVVIAGLSVAGVAALDVLCAMLVSAGEEQRDTSTPSLRTGNGSRRIRVAAAPGFPETGEKAWGEELLDINEATREDLLAIDGISETAADGILRYRSRHGHISRMYDLERLPQLTADEFMILRETVQITAESEEEEAHRLEKPDLATEVGGRGM